MVQKSSTSITLKWQTIIGGLPGYKIKFKKAGNGQYEYKDIRSKYAFQLQVEISDLEKNTLYQIQVAGYTEDGVGPYSEMILEKTEDGKSYILKSLPLCSIQYIFYVLVILCKGKLKSVANVTEWHIDQ